MSRPFTGFSPRRMTEVAVIHENIRTCVIDVTVNYCQYAWVCVSVCSKLQPCLWTWRVARPRISWDHNGLGQVMSHWLPVDISWVCSAWALSSCLADSICFDEVGMLHDVSLLSSLNWNHSCTLESWPPKQVSCVSAEDSFERGLLGLADLCLGACHPKSWAGDSFLWHPSKLSS